MASREVKVTILGDEKDLLRATQHADAALGGLDQKITSFARNAAIALGAVGAAATALGFNAVRMASDTSESLSKVRVVFGESAAQIEAFAQSAATSLGLSRQQALEAAGTFGNLFTAMGLNLPLAAQMSQSILQLAADLASFNNIPVDVALEKLRAGLVGEVEPLRTLGVNLSAAAVELKAMELGLKQGEGALSAAAKAQAAYALIIESTSNAHGDFARTSDGLANSQRILRARLADAQAELGEALLPYMLEATRVAINLADNMEVLAGAVVALGGSIALATVPITGPGGMIIALGLLGTAAFLLRDDWETAISAMPSPVQQMALEVAGIFDGISQAAANMVNGIIGMINDLLASLLSLNLGSTPLGKKLGLPDLTPRLNLEAVPRFDATGAVEDAIAWGDHLRREAGLRLPPGADPVTGRLPSVSDLPEFQPTPGVVTAGGGGGSGGRVSSGGGGGGSGAAAAAAAEREAEEAARKAKEAADRALRGSIIGAILGVAPSAEFNWADFGSNSEAVKAFDDLQKHFDDVGGQLRRAMASLGLTMSEVEIASGRDSEEFQALQNQMDALREAANRLDLMEQLKLDPFRDEVEQVRDAIDETARALEELAEAERARRAELEKTRAATFAGLVSFGGPGIMPLTPEQLAERNAQAAEFARQQGSLAAYIAAHPDDPLGLGWQPGWDTNTLSGRGGNNYGTINLNVSAATASEVLSLQTLATG